jgi:phospholipid transport system substrate-binding protein
MSHRRVRGLVQAGFIAGLLAAGAAFAQGAAKPVTTNGKPAPAAVDNSGPSQLIESSANIMLAGIDSRREEFRKDPTGLYKLVGETLLPNFDTPFAAERVLGQHWRKATEDQRKRFIDAFYESLLYTYGDAMVDFTADRLKVFPTKADPSAKDATVRTQIKRSDGTRVDVNYRMHKVDGAWKAWDVVIDNISYVKSYRDDYSAQIQQQGIEAVIKRLEDRATEAKARSGKGGAAKAKS